MPKKAPKSLIRLTPGVNFINILRVAFAPVDPKSVKRIRIYYKIGIGIGKIMILLFIIYIKLIQKLGFPNN